MPQKFDPEQWVYKPDAKLTVLGIPVPVSGFVLYLSANGIPRLSVTIDPFHVWEDPREPAKAPTLAVFARRWRALQEAIRSRTNRLIQFKFDAGLASGAEVPQKFELKDWIMVSAGFTEIQARGSFALVIEAVHPLYEFQESSAHMLGTGVQHEIQFNEVSGSNVHELLIKTMRAYLLRHENDVLAIPTATDPDYTDTAVDMKSVREEYRKMIDILEAKLIWDPTFDGRGLPTKPLKLLEDITKYGAVEYVKSIDNAGSWDWFIRGFCTEWFLTVIPTFYAEKLALRPIEPWLGYKMRIYDTDISGMTLPAVDPTPIKGIQGLFDSSAMASIEYANWHEGEEFTSKEEISWTEPLLGRYLTMGMPGWLRGLVINQQARDAGKSSPSSNNISGSVTYVTGNTAADEGPGTLGTVNPAYLKEQDLAMKVACKELFLENYRQFFQLTLMCRLFMKSDLSMLPDKWILPGFVMRLLPNPDALPASTGAPRDDVLDKPIIDFFVTQVVHSVDCHSGTANTQIAGSYIHEPDAPMLKAIQAGVGRNPFYLS
jgi:hypothetical protein